MAEEAFALSPISARPNLPGEADYEAIREAFMETARGRWFLNEYAKRNRHTDTGMVLEAVARIEANLKAQKQAPTSVSLSDALGHIRSAVRHAKATAIESLPRADSNDTLTASRNGARIVREIAWTLRECGADTRICDLLDTQVKAIEAGLTGVSDDGRENVLASYDLLMQRIEALVDGHAAELATPAVKTEAPAPAAPKPAAAAEARTSVTPLFKAPAPEAVIEQAATPEPVVVQAAMPEPMVEEMIAPTVEVAPAVAEAATPTAELAETHATATEVSLAETTEEPAVEVADAALEAEAHDLAVLDLIAVEMAVQDFSEPDEAEPETDEPEMMAPAIEPAPVVEPGAMPTRAAPVAPAAPAAAAPVVAASVPYVAPVALAPEPEPEPRPEPQPSLGAALIASGVISSPNAPVADPLAPIRRMSQAEKIAFFS